MNDRVRVEGWSWQLLASLLLPPLPSALPGEGSISAGEVAGGRGRTDSRQLLTSGLVFPGGVAGKEGMIREPMGPDKS